MSQYKERVIFISHLPEPTAKIAEIRADHPLVDIIFRPTSSKEVTSGLPDPDTTALFQDVTILVTSRVMPSNREDAPNLKIIQLTSSGIDRAYKSIFFSEPRDLPVITTSSGAASVPIAEWVLMATLTASRKYDLMAAQHREHLWERSKFLPPLVGQDWAGKTVGIAGYGSIGRQVARIFHALGTKVHAHTARPRLTPESRRDDGYVIPGTGDADGIIPTAWFSGTDKPSLHTFLRSGLDILVICLALTNESRGMFSCDEFAALSSPSPSRNSRGQHSCFLVNVARGAIIDTPSLINALEQGQLSGAALDVTELEPLPSHDPLWNARNCFISPHISWSGAEYLDRCLDILFENLGRRARGLDLLNSVKL